MFDFTSAMEGLITHISANHPRFRHVQPDKLVVAYIRTRTPGVHGLYASVRPLRFEGGAQTITLRGRTYAMPELIHNGKEVLYIVSFALPRFLNLDFETKLTTVFHELYHISPKFNGDIRRFRGKNYAHGHSRKRFNEIVGAMAQEYLDMPGADVHTAFLKMTFDEMNAEYGHIVGSKVRAPKPRLV